MRDGRACVGRERRVGDEDIDVVEIGDAAETADTPLGVVCDDDQAVAVAAKRRGIKSVG